MSFKMTRVKAFFVFLAVLFVGMQAGGWIADTLAISTGNTSVDLVITWIIIALPAWLIFRRWKLAKQSIAKGAV